MGVTDPPDDRPEEAAGIRCPVCRRTDFRTTHVYRLQDGRVKRRKVCQNPACRRPLYTFEAPSEASQPNS